MLDFHASVVPLVLFLGGVISMKILDAGFSFFCCFIGSVSGKKGLEIRAVHFGAGPKVRVGWKGFGMGMLLSMDSCPCELSRAGRSFSEYIQWSLGDPATSCISPFSLRLHPKSRSACIIAVLSFRCDRLDLVYLPSPYTRAFGNNLRPCHCYLAARS